MSNFIGKIGEKLHMGGHKKEGEHDLAVHEAQHPPFAGNTQDHVDHAAYEAPHPPFAGNHKDHIDQPHGAYQEPLQSQPYPVYGGEHHSTEAGQPGFAVVHEQHIGEHHATGVPPHEGPLEHKIKGQKHDGKEDGSSSSSSSESESDGEGGRRRTRKKKLGII